jgi:ribose transport system ATP-binding protein
MLSLRSVSKSFAGVHAVRNVSFDVVPGEIHALVGENGAGKSTLMRILSGVYTDYDGEITLDGEPVAFSSPGDAQSHGIAIIHQELNLIPELSVAANIFLGREPRTPFGTVANRTIARDAAELLRTLRLSISPHQRVVDLRVGEQQMVEIAKALSLEARFLILDEPTSALSETEIAALFTVIRELKARNVAMVYISHKFDEIFALADRITVLRDGENVGTVPTAEIDQAGLIRRMVGRDLTDMFPKGATPTGHDVLRVEGLSFTPPVDSLRRSLHDVSFTLRGGEILGVAGLMGAGRTELLETIFGVHPRGRTAGSVSIGGEAHTFNSPRDAIRHGLAFVTEDRKSQSLVLMLPVGQNITLAALRRVSRLGIIRSRVEGAMIRSAIDSMRIRTRNAAVTVDTLSGGNQQKVALAKSLNTSPRVLLLDEPTRGIDIGAKAEIYALMSALADQGTGILMASSELPELLAMCDRIMVLSDGHLVTTLDAATTNQAEIMEAATSRLRSRSAQPMSIHA